MRSKMTIYPLTRKVDLNRVKAINFYTPMANFSQTQHFTQFRHMNAYESEWFNYHVHNIEYKVKAFKSYSTIVALIVIKPGDEEATIVEMRGWSPTTSKQQTAWVGEMFKWVDDCRYLNSIHHIIIEVERIY